MPLVVEPEPVPLTTGPDGVARIGATRVTLDSVVGAFREGATAEEILQQYPVPSAGRRVLGHRLLLAAPARS